MRNAFDLRPRSRLRSCLIAGVATLWVVDSPVGAQEVFRDDFNSPNGPLVGTLADLGNFWWQTGTSATNPIQIVDGAVTLGGVGQDVYAPLSRSVLGSDGFGLVTSFDLTVTSAQSAGDYFLHLSDPVGTTSLFYQRLFARSSPGGFQLGLLDTSGAGSATTWGSQELAYGTTYHVDVNWNFLPGTADDTFSIDLDGNPYLSHTWTSAFAEPGQISAVNFRQGNSTATVPALTVDNLVVFHSRPPAPFNIYKWEYIDPDNPGLGKQESDVVTVDGYGVQAQPGMDGSSRNFSMAYLAGADLSNANLYSANLTGAYMPQVNLTNANVGANLTGADLRQANLTGAQLYLAVLAGADLREANLFHATVWNTNLVGANLTDAEIRGAGFSFATPFGLTAAQLYSTASYQAGDLREVDLSWNDLSGWNFAGMNLTSTSFSSATLAGADLSGSDLGGAQFLWAVLSAANLSGADLSGAQLDFATLAEANLTGAHVNFADFSNSDLTPAQFYSTASYAAHDLTGIGLAGVAFAGANLANKNLSNANLNAADFSGANLSGANLTGAQVDFANFNGAGLTLAQLASTASFQSGYLPGIGLAQANLAGGNLSNKNLGYADFSSANLAGANFTNALLDNAKLTHANLTGANFSGARVNGADFEGTGLTLTQLYSTASYQSGQLIGIGLAHSDLTGVDLIYAALYFANFSFANLSGANLSYTNLSGANLTGANFSGANFTGASIAHADFSGSNLTLEQIYAASSNLAGIGLANMNLADANFANKDLTFANLSSSNLSGANLENARLGYATLAGANFTGANVRGAFFGTSDVTPEQLYSTASYLAHDLNGVDLVRTNLAGADFSAQNLHNAVLYGADLTGASFSQANLSGAKLSSAILTGADFTGADVRGAAFILGPTGMSAGQLASTASYQAHDLSGVDIHSPSQPTVSFAGLNLTGARLTGTFRRANFSQANLSSVDLGPADLTGANLAGANLTGAHVQYARLSSTNITLDQLYSTASYLSHNMTGVELIGNDLRGGDFSGQTLYSANFYAAKLQEADFSHAQLTGANLVNADLSQANLANANLSGAALGLANFAGADLQGANLSGAFLIGTSFHGANLRGANLGRAEYRVITEFGCGPKTNGAPCDYTTVIVGTGITVSQLSTSANYVDRDLSDVSIVRNDLNGANFADFNLQRSDFTGSTLSGANLSRADARGAVGLSSNAANLIHADGHIAGLQLAADQTLIVRDYDGPENIAVTVNTRFTMASTATLKLIFDADAWGSKISFSPGIPVALGGSLQLAFADGVDLAGQVGRTFELFDWTGVTPTGLFAVVTSHNWDISNLYTTGEVTFLAPGGLPGDFNADGRVDAGDYVRWRNQFGDPDEAAIHHNGDGGGVTLADYQWWKQHYGTPGGGGLAPSAPGAPPGAVPAVPETATRWLLAAALVAAARVRRTRFSVAVAAGLAAAVLPGGPSFAAPPNVQLTRIANPVWKLVDFQLFSAPATPFDQAFGHVYNTLLPIDTPLAAGYVPHAPPYDTELSAGMLAGGYVSQANFAPHQITLNPNGVYLAYMMVPDPGIIGSSRDFASGPVVPNSLFPLANNADVWLDGVLVDRTPGIDGIIPVQPRDVGKTGTSHLELLQAIWHPWDDDLTVSPLGDYELRVSLRDIGGNGWDVVVPFQVVQLLPGDFNADGRVDAGDYVRWRNHLGDESESAINFNGDGGGIALSDYSVWKQHYGSPGGTGGVAQGGPTPSRAELPVPEPCGLTLALLGGFGLICRRR